MNKFKTKLELTSVPISNTKDKIEVVNIKSKQPVIKAIKSVECFIYLGRLKANPKILITQLRFEAFKSVPECEEWCEAHCSEYEIRNHKTGTTIQVKKDELSNSKSK